MFDFPTKAKITEPIVIRQSCKRLRFISGFLGFSFLGRNTLTKLKLQICWTAVACVLELVESEYGKIPVPSKACSPDSVML